MSRMSVKICGETTGGGAAFCTATEVSRYFWIHIVSNVPVLAEGFEQITTKITRLPPRDFNFKKRPIGNSGAFFCSPDGVLCFVGL